MTRGTTATEMLLVSKTYSLGVSGKDATSKGKAIERRGRQTIEKVASVDAMPQVASSPRLPVTCCSCSKHGDEVDAGRERRPRCCRVENMHGIGGVVAWTFRRASRGRPRGGVGDIHGHDHRYLLGGGGLSQEVGHPCRCDDGLVHGVARRHELGDLAGRNCSEHRDGVDGGRGGSNRD